MSPTRNIIAVNSSIFVIMFGLGSCFTYLPDKMTYLSGSVNMSGFLASAFGLAYIIAQYPLGKIADLFGFRKIIIAGFLLCSLSGIIYYAADSAHELIIGRIIQGIGEAPLWSLSPIFLTLLYPENKARVLGWYTASFHFGLTAGPIAGTYIADFLGVQIMFLTFSAASALGGLIILAFVSPQYHAPKKNNDSINIMSIIKPLNKSVLAGIVMYGASYGLIVSVIPAFMLSVKNLDHSSVNAAFSASFFLLGIIQILSGNILTKHNMKRMLLAGMSFLGVGLLIIIYSSENLLITGLLMHTAGLGVFSIASMFYLQLKTDSAHAGVSSGIYFLFWGIGYFIFPFLIGIFNFTNLLDSVLLLQTIMFFAVIAVMSKTLKN